MRYILLLLLVSVSCPALGNEHIKAVATAVLHELYIANGNHTKPVPAIRITQDPKNPALFLKRQNTIELSEKTYLLCRRFEADSLAALAFILGHELAHVFQTRLTASTTSFSAREHYHQDGSAAEESADIQGMFMAYLAGFENARHILPGLIDLVYEHFGLQAELAGYPALSERQKTAEKTIAQANELIQLFEAGTYLMAIERYDLAIACFEHISNAYSGREIYNNIGVCYALLAMNTSAENPVAYVFPFEISWETRMRKIRGTDMGAQSRAYLEKATRFLQQAIEREPDIEAYQTNLMCVLTLSSRAEEALFIGNALLEKRTARSNSGLSGTDKKLLLALALAYAYLDNPTAAAGLWAKTRVAGGPEAGHAAFNARVLNGEPNLPDPASPCPVLHEAKRMIDGIELHTPLLSDPIVLTPNAENTKTRFAFHRTPNSVVYYIADDDETITTIQRVFDPMLQVGGRTTGIGLFTDIGILVHCPQQQVVLLFDLDDRLKEWGKYLVLKQ